MEYFYYAIILSFILNLRKNWVCRLLHWGPIIALLIIGTITTSAIFTHYKCWPPNSWRPFCNMVALISWLNIILYHFYRASAIGPGYVPNEWKPQEAFDSVFVQYCTECLSYKCPRSHHCSKCQRCVMKMDHHCPWINNCVGHFNHHHFVIFLFVVPFACLHALLCMVPCLYHALYRNFYLMYGDGNDPIINMSIPHLIGSFLSAGMAIGVILAVGVLFCMQLRSILKNETGIESWIKDKAEYRKESGPLQDPFIFPYNLGRWKNWKMVFWWHECLDGITWPIRKDCHQYTLTVEQIQQKKSKRSQSVIFSIIKRYTGCWMPMVFGCRTMCNPPCIDEARLKVEKGDSAVVTRYKKHWLYGEKLKITHGDCLTYHGKSERGWFPKNCAIKSDEMLPFPLYKLPPCHLKYNVDVEKLDSIANERFLGKKNL